ncbi:DUF6452 family protein [Wenyingzhuangia sp. IMCC45574]
MKKISLLLLGLGIFTAFYSCQDEFCVEPTTPELIIRFYNKDSINESTKRIALVAKVDDVTIPYFNVNTGDSISFPINTQDTSVTYEFSIQDSVPSTEILTINYTVEDVFVSRACGFKSVFKNLTIESTKDNWIDSIVQVTNEINDQTQAHVKIYH